MKLITMELENFQQIKQLTIQFDGKDMLVEGRNETGKTTVANAYMWLLTGSSYTNEVNYSPQTVINKELVHHLEHGVTCVFDDGGEMFTLRRAYKEKWTKPRNKPEKELTGGTYIYEIDGVNVTMRDFEAYVASRFGDTETIQILSKPEYFGDNSDKMTWQRRREIIMGLTTSMTTEEVIDLNPSLADLREHLKKPVGSGVYTISELESMAKRDASATAQQIKEIPARIDENARKKPRAFLPAEIAEKQATISELKDKALELNQKAKDLEEQSGDQAKRTQMAELRVKMAERQGELSDLHMDATKDLQEASYAAQEHYAVCRTHQDSIQKDIEEHDRLIAKIKLSMDLAESKLSDIQGQIWEGDTECYACGQTLPIEELQSAKEAFNLKKAEQQEQLAGEIKELQEALSQTQKNLTVLRKGIKEVEAKTEEAKGSYDELTEKLRQIKAPDIATDEVYIGYQEAIDSLEAEEEDTSRTFEILEIKQKRNELIEQVQEIEAELDTQKQIAAFDERIQELEEEKRKATEANEKAERKLWLVEQYQLTKSRALTGEVNSYFDTDIVQFKLYDYLKKGDPVEACEVLVKSKEGNLVEFKAANRGGRINAGLELIRVLSTLYGRSLPVIVDNAESVNQLRSGHAQLIQLHVTNKDHELKFTTEGTPGPKEGSAAWEQGQYKKSATGFEDILDMWLEE